MRAWIPIALAAMLSATNAAAQEAPRYIVDFSVLKAGAPVASAQAIIAEGGQAEINLVGADAVYTFTADLQPVQGDGEDGSLMIEAYVNRDGEDLANPRLTIRRGGTARFELGEARGASGELQEGVKVTLSPVAD
ncbi:hypothetical protein [Brevundimonas sp. NIBR11]|uniref:hypothetical protein n=1 Tax=Brevundimonas sp. NIBR11 TaxID=3015999 RepID=UPI0022F03731|nr:hypothetical protein [Brevundimonas sp. NIBR11]WGM31373.1 hypothetical protein KKHFBJBL_01617 [Brevundimonas sp. NIBR11]